MTCKKNKTLTYDEKVTGWTSFHSFTPDSMVGMNSRFFSFSNGNLHVHHSENVARNSYYGEVSPSKLSLMVNDEPNTIKEIQNVSLEGNYPWDTKLNAFVLSQDNPTRSSIKELEYVNKEGFWYAYARRNEDPLQLDSRSSYGIGVALSTVDNIINYSGESSSLAIGDRLFLGQNMELVGVIESYTTNTITLQNPPLVTLPTNGFLIGAKDARIEGGNLRGYTLRLDLEIDKPDKVELFAVNTDVIKSYS